MVSSRQRIFSFLLTFFILFSIISLSPNKVFADEQMKFSVGNVTVPPGSTTVDVPITITNNPGFAYWTVVFDYDSSVLSIASTTSFSCSDWDLTYSWPNVNLAKRFSFHDHPSGGDDPVLVDSFTITVHFDILQNADEGDYNISLSEAANSCYKPDWTAFPADFASYSSGKLTIGETSGPTSYDITVTEAENGTITPVTGAIESGAVAVEEGEDQAFTITPDSGYQIKSVTVDSNEFTEAFDNVAKSYAIGGGGTATFTFKNVTAAHAISAEFEAVQAPSTGDDEAISAALALVEAATYTADQADVGTIGDAKSAVEAIIAALGLDGVETAVTDVAFTAATAGTEEDAGGTDGSYTFTVALNKGGGTEQTTSELMLTIAATPYAQAPQTTAEATINVGTEVGYAGDTVTVPVSIADNPGFASYAFEAKYDSDVLELQDITKGNVTDSIVHPAESLNPARVSFVNADGNIGGDGVLFNLVFEIKEDAPEGNNAVTVELADEDEKNFVQADETKITPTVSPGAVSVSATKTPTAADLGSDISDTRTYNGEPQTVNVTKTQEIGEITVYYTGTNGTSYEKSTTAPTNAGSYKVIAEVAANEDYAAATLELGTLVIKKQPLTFAYPTVSGDKAASTTLDNSWLSFTSNVYGTFAWTNSAETTGTANAYHPVTFTPNAPYNDGNYSYAATGNVFVSVGTLNDTWTVADLTITYPADLTYNTQQKAVTVVGKDGMGAITVKYESLDGTTYAKSATAPTNAGSYKVYVEVAEGTAYTAKSFTLAETLVIAKKQITIAWPALTDKVAKNSMLGAINLGSNTYGTFAWSNPDTVVTTTGAYEATFTPNESHQETNYDYGEKTHDITVTINDDRMKGDGDGDGSITITDINYLANLVAKNTTDLSADDKEWLDMDGDGLFTITDLIILAKLFVGLG